MLVAVALSRGWDESYRLMFGTDGTASPPSRMVAALGGEDRQRNSVIGFRQSSTPSGASAPHIWRPRDGRNAAYGNWEHWLKEQCFELEIEYSKLPIAAPTLESVVRHIATRAAANLEEEANAAYLAAFSTWQKINTSLYFRVGRSLDLSGVWCDADTRFVRGLMGDNAADGYGLIVWARSFADMGGLDIQGKLRANVAAMQLNPRTSLVGLHRYCNLLYSQWILIVPNDPNNLTAYWRQLLIGWPTVPASSHLVVTRTWVVGSVSAYERSINPLFGNVDSATAAIIDYARSIGLYEGNAADVAAVNSMLLYPVMGGMGTLADTGDGALHLVSGFGALSMADNECDMCDNFGCKSRLHGGALQCICLSTSTFDLGTLPASIERHGMQLRAYHRANPTAVTLKGLSRQARGLPALPAPTSRGRGNGRGRGGRGRGGLHAILEPVVTDGDSASAPLTASDGVDSPEGVLALPAVSANDADGVLVLSDALGPSRRAPTFLDEWIAQSHNVGDGLMLLTGSSLVFECPTLPGATWHGLTTSVPRPMSSLPSCVGPTALGVATAPGAAGVLRLRDSTDSRLLRCGIQLAGPTDDYLLTGSDYAPAGDYAPASGIDLLVASFAPPVSGLLVLTCGGVDIAPDFSGDPLSTAACPLGSFDVPSLHQLRRWSGVDRGSLSHNRVLSSHHINSVVAIQSLARGRRARRHLSRSLSAAICIQSWVRAYLDVYHRLIQVDVRRYLSGMKRRTAPSLARELRQRGQRVLAPTVDDTQSLPSQCVIGGGLAISSRVSSLGIDNTLASQSGNCIIGAGLGVSPDALLMMSPSEPRSGPVPAVAAGGVAAAAGGGSDGIPALGTTALSSPDALATPAVALAHNYSRLSAGGGGHADETDENRSPSFSIRSMPFFSSFGSSRRRDREMTAEEHTASALLLNVQRMSKAKRDRASSALQLVGQKLNVALGTVVAYGIEMPWWRWLTALLVSRTIWPSLSASVQQTAIGVLRRAHQHLLQVMERASGTTKILLLNLVHRAAEWTSRVTQQSITNGRLLLMTPEIMRETTSVDGTGTLDLSLLSTSDITSIGNMVSSDLLGDYTAVLAVVGIDSGGDRIALSAVGISTERFSANYTAHMHIDGSDRVYSTDIASWQCRMRILLGNDIASLRVYDVTHRIRNLHHGNGASNTQLPIVGGQEGTVLMINHQHEAVTVPSSVSEISDTEVADALAALSSASGPMTGTEIVGAAVQQMRITNGAGLSREQLAPLLALIESGARDNRTLCVLNAALFHLTFPMEHADIEHSAECFGVSTRAVRKLLTILKPFHAHPSYVHPAGTAGNSNTTLALLDDSTDTFAYDCESLASLVEHDGAGSFPLDLELPSSILDYLMRDNSASSSWLQEEGNWMPPGLFPVSHSGDSAGVPECSNDTLLALCDNGASSTVNCANTLRGAILCTHLGSDAGSLTVGTVSSELDSLGSYQYLVERFGSNGYSEIVLRRNRYTPSLPVSYVVSEANECRVHGYKIIMDGEGRSMFSNAGARTDLFMSAGFLGWLKYKPVTNAEHATRLIQLLYAGRILTVDRPVESLINNRSALGRLASADPSVLQCTSSQARANTILHGAECLLALIDSSVNTRSSHVQCSPCSHPRHIARHISGVPAFGGMISPPPCPVSVEFRRWVMVHEYSPGDLVEVYWPSDGNYHQGTVVALSYSRQRFAMAGRALIGVPAVLVARYHIVHVRSSSFAAMLPLDMRPSPYQSTVNQRTHVYLKHRTDIRLAVLPATGLFAWLSQDLFTLILSKSESLDVIAFMQTCKELRCDVNMSGVLHRCYNNILWGQRILERFAYFCAADECIHPLRHLVSLRRACQFSARKNERGVRRAVLRDNRNNALIELGDLAVSTLYNCISRARRGLTRPRLAPVHGFDAMAQLGWQDVD